jgi:glucosamine-6-phosphate deaminase
MVIKILENKEAIGKAAAALFNAQVIKKPESTLGLATGSSVLTTYAEMINAHKAGITDYSQVFSFNLDEYCGLDGSHEQSYRYFMNENLFRHININPEYTHFPTSNCAEYEEDILLCYGIDLQLLGLGHNGHIAFNEPCDRFPSTTHVVELAESTIEANSRFFASKDDVPKSAITMGIGTIMRAKSIVMVVFGEEKADAVAAMVNGAVTPQCPASVLQLHNDVTILTDKAAASRL